MQLLAGISVTCFAASYALALALEVTRLAFRSRARRWVRLGWGAAGLVAHTAYLAYRAVGTGKLPLSTEYDWYLLAAWVLAALYLSGGILRPRIAGGLFLLPLVLGLIAVAVFLAEVQPFPQTQAAHYWGMVHAAFWLLGSVSVTIGFVAGLMHLLHSYRLRHKMLPLRGLTLPSLEWLERVSVRALVFSTLFLSVGFVSGLILNAVNRRLELDDLPWSDPVIWSSGLLWAWLAAATLFIAVYRPARQGRKIAYLTVASFVILAAMLGAQRLWPTEHAAPGQATSEPGPQAARTLGQRLLAGCCRSASWEAVVARGRTLGSPLLAGRLGPAAARAGLAPPRYVAGHLSAMFCPRSFWSKGCLNSGLPRAGRDLPQAAREAA
ncbi:MAG: hypothetical protein K6T86_19160 [Pirellulales bacterium]|nr:hypothetical protein [Pirellulales bacterium]